MYFVITSITTKKYMSLLFLRVYTSTLNDTLFWANEMLHYDLDFKEKIVVAKQAPTTATLKFIVNDMD
jgi:hypothetical protein